MRGCEDAFQFAEFDFAFVDDVFWCFFCNDVVFMIDLPDDLFVELEVDDAALVVDWASCAIFD